jgi:putative cell wall-binding protein
VTNDSIPDSVKNILTTIKPNKVYIIGEQGAIGDNVKNQVEQLTSLGGESIVRIGGADRYETSVAIAKYFNLSGRNICVTTGEDFPDALAGSIYAANFNSPIILIDGSISNDVMSYLKDRKMTGATLFGGDAAVSEDIKQKLSQMIGK